MRPDDQFSTRVIPTSVFLRFVCLDMTFRGHGFEVYFGWVLKSTSFKLFSPHLERWCLEVYDLHIVGWKGEGPL